MTETTLTECRATVDYPQKGEVVTAPQYTIRIDASNAWKVDVSIDDGSWRSCRYSGGYWWYDWSGYLPGKHQVMAQAHTEGGQVVASRPQQFTVSLPGTNQN